MLTPIEASKVDGYLFENYSLNESDLKFLEEIDNTVLDFQLTTFMNPKQASKELLELANGIYDRMKEMFEIDMAITPRMLQYQERMNQLLIMYAKMNDLEGMYIDNLALLCFVSSLDLYYLQGIKNKR